MKYNIGDKVRIKSLDWYNENKDPKHGFVYLGNGICFYSHMSKYCGKTMTISEIFGCYYVMTEHGYDNWTDEMIEELVEEATDPELKFEESMSLVEETTKPEDSMSLVEEEIDLIPKFGEYSDINPLDIPTMTTEFVKEHGLPCPNGYIFKDENGNVINATKIVLEKKKKEYPKTFLECCDVLNIENLIERGVKGYKAELFDTLQKLYICRDAYWKIAGEEMGLSGSWEPNWDDGCYVIFTNGNGLIKRDIQFDINAILAFPTEEMRDAFYENFKKDIEKCKELL